LEAEYQEDNFMDIVQSLNLRKSVRAFTSEAVSREALNEIMTLALRAPSWANTQPWEFAIASGDVLSTIRRCYIEKLGSPITPDIPHVSFFPEPYYTRCHTAVAKSHASKGIQRENKEQRRWWETQQLSNFGAPCEIYIYIDRSFFYHPDDSPNVWPVYDCGAIAGIITLLAPNYNLGTIIQARAVVYPEILREILGLAESKIMLVGIGIGHPDLNDPVNKCTSEREPLEKLVHWYGFKS
jgi:nitroreductase